MTKLSKILATGVVIIVFLILSALLQLGSDPGGRNPGIIGIIIFVGLIVAIRAIWKKPMGGKSDITDLDKS